MINTEATDIIHATIKREGGFVNDLVDRGGATKYGVTIGTLRTHGIDVNDDGVINIKDVKCLSYEDAMQVYYDKYWVPADVGDLPERLREFYFDMCINHGIGGAVKILQRAINNAGRDIAIDGIIGPQTKENANVITLKELVYERIYYYSVIVYNDRSQMRFRKGWYNRAFEFLNKG